MSIVQSFDAITDRLQHSAGSNAVFGEPIVAEGKTIIPVARIRYGFGGGFGAAETATEIDVFDEEFGEEEHDERPTGEGGGMGGGVDASPVGVVEITETETRFVRFADRRRLAAVFFGGLVFGGLLARRGREE